MRKIRFFFCLILLLLLFSIEIASAKTWYLDDSGGANFTKIQDAVNASSDGNTIIVNERYEGTIYEAKNPNGHVVENECLNQNSNMVRVIINLPLTGNQYHDLKYSSMKVQPKAGDEVIIKVILLNTDEDREVAANLREEMPSSICVTDVEGATDYNNGFIRWEGKIDPGESHTINHKVIVEEKRDISFYIDVGDIKWSFSVWIPLVSSSWFLKSLKSEEKTEFIWLYFPLSFFMFFLSLYAFVRTLLYVFKMGEESRYIKVKRSSLNLIGYGICFLTGLSAIISCILYSTSNITSVNSLMFGYWLLYSLGVFITLLQFPFSRLYKYKAKRLEELPKVEKKEEYATHETITMEGILPQIPNHQVLKRIGFGRFADVYLARKSNNELVAIKIPKIKQFETVSSTVFLKEVSIWKNLNHPNIVELYEYNENPIPWFSMEYIDGGALKERLNQLSITECIKIIIKIAKALEYAHNKGIIHRDIKPENILFKGSEPKIADWGLGKLKSSVSTMSMEFKGTLMYASPEQFDPSTYGRVDKRTDIYQLGTLFYEILTKESPFEASDILSIREKKIAGKIVEPSKLNPGIPKRIDKIVMKCLAKNKEERYQNLSGLIRELSD
jgi:hypothetical protein